MRFRSTTLFACVLLTGAVHAGVGDPFEKLLATDGAALDSFGYSVSISGATAIVGAYTDGDNGCYSGSANLFNASTGQEIAKLLPSDGAAMDFFGQSVAIVGAYGDNDFGTESGAAYLFDTN
jgi:hypothetical protein